MADSPVGFLRKRLTYANVIATLALFIALGGTSYAVTALPKNSVGTQQLKKSAVTSVKVKDGSLVAADFAAGTLLKGETGATGAQGAAGPQGPVGPSGSVTGIEGYWNGGSASNPLPAASTSALFTGNFSVNGLGSNFVYGLAGIDGQCTAGNAPVVGLYYQLNGAATWTPVPKSGLQIDNLTGIRPVMLMGMIDYSNLAAGNVYNLTMRVGCTPAGSWTTSQVTGGGFGNLNIGTG